MITALVQSSTATTVITVGLVSAGVVSFSSSLGIIFGANIGTTVTAQLVAFKVTAFAPLFIIAGFLISIFGRSYKYIGKGMFYFGLLFFGLTLISTAIEPIKNEPHILELFSALSNALIAVIAGFIFTVIVQSSSVTTGMVVVLAGSGLVTLEHGIPILLGANIGTTVTTIISSIRFGLHAKRAAVAHVLFNLIGAILLLSLIGPFSNLIEYIGGSTAQQIANAHTVFNVGAALLFLILLKPFKILVEKIVRGTEEEILLTTKYLPEKLPDNNEEVFSLIEKELAYSLEITRRLFDKAVNYLKHPNGQELNTIDKLEVLNDLIDERIEAALLETSRRKLTSSQAEQIVLLVRISNLIEQLGDVSHDLSELPRTMTKGELSLSRESYKGIDLIYSRFKKAYLDLSKGFPNNSSTKVGIILKSESIYPLISKGYKNHVELLKEKKAYAGSIYVESLSVFEGSVTKLKELGNLANTYTLLRKKDKKQTGHN